MTAPNNISVHHDYYCYYHYHFVEFSSHVSILGGKSVLFVGYGNDTLHHKHSAETRIIMSFITINICTSGLEKMLPKCPFERPYGRYILPNKYKT